MAEDEENEVIPIVRRMQTIHTWAYLGARSGIMRMEPIQRMMGTICLTQRVLNPGYTPIGLKMVGDITLISRVPTGNRSYRSAE